MTDTVHIPVADAGPAVRDIMLREARAVGPDTPVADVRETFANPKVKLLLVTDGERFLGTIGRDDLPAGDGGTIEAHVRADAPRVSPDEPVARALELVEATGLSRIPVVGDGERLQGLVCFNAEHAAFCVSPT
ncbi:MAG TPA: CBS domain-containing protein [Solirubrobacter sp.]|jgi:CBS domain-containing protein|nr:CBS domain-containing protein [Solirubrobacter sp.]